MRKSKPNYVLLRYEQEYLISRNGNIGNKHNHRRILGKQFILEPVFNHFQRCKENRETIYNADNESLSGVGVSQISKKRNADYAQKRGYNIHAQRCAEHPALLLRIFYQFKDKRCVKSHFHNRHCKSGY